MRSYDGGKFCWSGTGFGPAVLTSPPGVKIEESFLLPAGWVMATQDDGIDTYLGPLSDMPVNPKFTRLKLARGLYAALTAPPRYHVPHTPADCRIRLKYKGAKI